MIDRSKEPYGLALRTHFTRSTSPTIIQLHVKNMPSRGVPVDMFFETPEEFLEIDKVAFQHCRGRVLDVGAGVGRFALPLQEQNMAVCALEQSQHAATIMKARGVKDIRCMELDEFLLLDWNEEKFDTVLMMMNGLGIVGTLANLEDFLEKIKPFVQADGQILADSTNVKAIPQSDFSKHIIAQNKRGKYFGEMELTFEYDGVMGPSIQWIHIDEVTLATVAKQHGWVSEILYGGGDGTFLTRLTKIG